MASRLAISGQTFLRFGSLDLSSFWKMPALIWRSRKYAVGTTTS